MLKFVQKKLKEEKGLTLIELLAVIVILGIIAAIAIPAIGNIIENSRVGALKSDAVAAFDAANLFLADNPGHTGNVVLENLEGSATAAQYLEDNGLTSFVYNVETERATFTTETVGGVSITTNTAAGVTKQAVIALPNNTNGDATGDAAGITVAR